MRRKTASISEAGAPSLYCIYNREDDIFEIVDATHRPVKDLREPPSPDEVVEPSPKTWRSRVQAVAEWVLTDLLAGFVSCAVSMNPHLFCMMRELDDHIETSKARPNEPEKR